MTRLLLFDIDGTLVNVDGAGRVAFREAMEEVYGETGPIDDFHFHGKTDPGIVRGLLRAAGREDDWIDRGMDRLWSRYLEALEAALADRRARLTVYDGVRHLLERLEEDDRFELALVTGNVQGGAWRKLEACRLRRPFRYGAFGSDSEERDDLPPLAVRRASRRLGRDFAAGDVWIIGDTPADIQCARHSNLRSLAVATGGYGTRELADRGAEHVLPSLADGNRVVEILAS